MLEFVAGVPEKSGVFSRSGESVDHRERTNGNKENDSRKAVFIQNQQLVND